MSTKMINEELKQEWLEKVKVKQRQDIWGKNGRFSVNTELHLAPDEIKEDYDINLNAALIGQEYLWNIHKKYSNDKNFILTLINYNYTRNIYDSLSYELKKDEELFLLCVKRNDHFDWSISEKILDNRDIILEAMKIKNIFSKLKNKYDLDKEIIQIYLEHDPTSFSSLKKSMKNYFSSPKRKDFIIKLMNTANSNHNNIYKELPIKLQEDLEIIDILLNKSKYNFEYLPELLRNDKGFVLYAIDKYNIVSIDKQMKEDRDVVEKIISKNGELLMTFPHFKNDEKMIELALLTYNKLDLLSEVTLSNKDLVLKFLEANPKNCDSLFQRTNKYCDDFDIMKLCVEYDGNFLTRSSRLRNNEELIDLALATSSNFNILSEKHIQNKSIVLQVLKNKSQGNCRNAISREIFLDLYWNDKDIAKVLIDDDVNNLKHFPLLRADIEFINEINNDKIRIPLNLIDPSLYTNKELILKYTTNNLSNYLLLPLSIKNDCDIALSVCDGEYQYSQIIKNSALGVNKNFTLKVIEKVPTIYEHIKEFSKFKLDLDVIVKYIECSMIYGNKIRLPKSICDTYDTTDPALIKSLILKNEIEDLLENKGIIGKKLKI